ncbi:MAG: hypothetical protein WD772_00235, partial [Pseudohongiellaceae bacterium]
TANALRKLSLVPVMVAEATASWCEHRKLLRSSALRKTGDDGAPGLEISIELPDSNQNAHCIALLQKLARIPAHSCRH